MIVPHPWSYEIWYESATLWVIRRKFRFMLKWRNLEFWQFFTCLHLDCFWYKWYACLVADTKDICYHGQLAVLPSCWTHLGDWYDSWFHIMLLGLNGLILWTKVIYTFLQSVVEDMNMCCLLNRLCPIDHISSLEVNVWRSSSMIHYVVKIHWPVTPSNIEVILNGHYSSWRVW